MITRTEEERSVTAARPRAWSEYVAVAMHARENRDSCQWTLGDVANEIRVFYGDDSIGKLATEIGMKKSSLMTYRLVARSFPPAKRIDSIPFTQHQICASTPTPETWLDKCADGMWTCEKLIYEIKNTAGGEEVQSRNDRKLQAAAQFLFTSMEHFKTENTYPSLAQCKNLVQRAIEIYRRGA